MHEPDLVQTAVRIGGSLLFDSLEHAKFVCDLECNVGCQFLSNVASLRDAFTINEHFAFAIMDDQLKKRFRLFVELIDKFFQYVLVLNYDLKEYLPAAESLSVPQHLCLPTSFALYICSSLQSAVLRVAYPFRHHFSNVIVLCLVTFRAQGAAAVFEQLTLCDFYARDFSRDFIRTGLFFILVSLGGLRQLHGLDQIKLFLVSHEAAEPILVRPGAEYENSCVRHVVYHLDALHLIDVICPTVR